MTTHGEPAGRRTGTYSSSRSDERYGAAGEHLARCDFIGGEHVRLVDAMVDPAVDDRALAVAAAAVAAVERKRDVLAQRGFEQRLTSAPATMRLSG